MSSKMEENLAPTRKRKCELCEKVEAIYRCPGCSMQTCSLPCVKQHKILKTCDGKRSKTAFVDIKEFSENNLLSDYRFLEDATRTASNATRDVKSKSKSHNKHRLNFIRQARARHINLHLMPYGMTKQKENTSMYNYKQKCLNWRLKLKFVNEGLEYIIPRVKETESLNEILNNYINPESSDPLIRYKLKSYVSCGMERIRVYLKREQSQEKGYYQLDLSQTLEQCLKEKTIFEYPELHIAIQGKDDEYQSTS